MSWQEYVDNNLVGTGRINKAAIVGQGGGVWAQSAGYNLSPQEQAAILKAHADLGNTQATGIRLGGQKFFTIHAEGRSIYGKKGPDGCLLVKTKQAILVAEYVAPTQAGEATTVVEGLADYLVGVGF